MSHHWASPGRNACHQLGCSLQEDPELDAVLHWLEAKKTDLRTLLGEHASSEEG